MFLERLTLALLCFTEAGCKHTYFYLPIFRDNHFRQKAIALHPQLSPSTAVDVVHRKRNLSMRSEQIASKTKVSTMHLFEALRVIFCFFIFLLVLQFFFDPTAAQNNLNAIIHVVANVYHSAADAFRR